MIMYVRPHLQLTLTQLQHLLKAFHMGLMAQIHLQVKPSLLGAAWFDEIGMARLQPHIEELMLGCAARIAHV